jgi:uncharacterized protein (TIGR02001 family)
MRTSTKALMAATLLASGLTAAPAFAQDEDALGGVTFSGYVQGVTDYRFRGLSASGGDPAIQGSINLNHASGFYAGAWASSIDDGGTDVLGEVELDLYAGWTGDVTPGLTADVGILRYVYPTNSFGPVDYWEPYASLGTTYGPLNAKVGVAYAWKQRALGFTDGTPDKDDNLYVFTDLSAGVPTTPITLNAHLGYADGAQSPKLLTRGPLDATGALVDRDGGFDYSVGATYNVTPKLSLSASYVGVDGASIDDFSDDTVVASIKLAL